MKKVAVAVLATCAALALSSAPGVYAKSDNYGLPDALEYEYSGTEIALPACSGTESVSYLVQVRDSEENIVAENVLAWHFMAGEYFLDYTVPDASDLTAAPFTHRVKLTVIDSLPPVIAVAGQYRRSYGVGEEITVLPAVASDLHDGTVEYAVEVSFNGRSIQAGETIIAEVGVYEIVYTATDAAGNPAESKFEITIAAAENGGMPWWGWCLIGGGVALAGVGVGVCVLRRKKDEKKD